MGRLDGAAGGVRSTKTDLAPERDITETALLQASIDSGWPVIGVCRGMQVLNVFHGGTLTRLSGHTGVRHALAVRSPMSGLPDLTFDGEVNSFHDFGITPEGLGKGLRSLADVDGWPEAFEHDDYRHLGIMWHPERCDPFSSNDLLLFHRFLGAQDF